MGHFVETIQHHAMSVDSDRWASLAYWVCFLSNNQWDLTAEVGNGDAEDSSFFRALWSRSCRATCMVLDEAALPLTRIWCIFEVMQAYRRLHEGEGSVYAGMRY